MEAMDASNNEGLRSLFEELKKTGKAHNQTHFAALLGESSRGNLSNYLNDVRPLGDALAKQYVLSVHSKLPEVSHPWIDQWLGDLLTGERGSEEDDEGNWARIRESPDEGQPYYDIDFLGGYGEFIDNPEDAHPEYFIDFKPYNRKGVFYVNLRGDSMAPEFNGGDLLALRPVEGWWEYLLLGKVYAIVTKQGQRTIKRLRKGTSPESYLLEPINPSYDTQDIPKDQIAAVFEVLGGIRHYE